MDWAQVNWQLVEATERSWKDVMEPKVGLQVVVG